MSRLIDRAAAGLSTLCVVHCLAGGVLILLFAPMAPLFGHELHFVGLGVAAVLAAAALGRGFMRHRRPEPAGIAFAGLALMAAGFTLGHGGMAEFVLTALGAALVAAAHFSNLRFSPPAHA